MIKMFKEPFIGNYDGITPPTLLPVGAVSDGLNVRKVGEGGGWKPRKGCTLHNTSVIGCSAATTGFLSLHQYTHPRNKDYHFLGQFVCVGDGGVLYDAANDPPASGATFGTAIKGSLSETVPGFSTMVGETFFYADGSGAPTVYGGTTPFCSGFLTVEDGTSANYIDYTREVTDEKSTSHAILFTAAAGRYYVCSPEIAEEIILDLGDVVNSNVVTVVVKSWQAGAWASRTGDGDWDDGTESGGATHAIDGTIAWTRQASDTMRVLGGIMGYWYEVTTSGAISANVKIISCKVVYDATVLSNKWNGVHEYPAAVRFYDQSETEYVDNTGKVTNESTSQYMQIGDMLTGDFIYVKGIEPLGGIGFGMVADYIQSAVTSKVDSFEVWTGVGWTAGGGIIDGTLNEAGTKGFTQSGIIWFNAAAVTAKRRTFDWDTVPGYWYRLGISANFTDDDIRVFMVSTTMFPDSLPAADGVIEFKNRLLTWGDPEYPNRLRYSANRRPDCLSGSDSGYTDAFGDMKPITCALRFHNELLVFKEDSVWLLEGYSPQTFGKLLLADTIGLASPKSAVVVETGYPAMRTDEPMSIAIWQDTDGVYVLDGRKPKKVSGPVDHYFNTEYATAIAAASINNRQSFVDPLNNEYHLLLPTSELVYNYIRAEWYPPWERSVDLLCGLSFRGTDNRYYVYGGSAGGQAFRLENDTSDKSINNNDVAISHKVKTRAISAKQPEATTSRFTFRKLWVEAQARTVATALVTTFFKNMATSGVVLNVPAVLDLQETARDLSVPGVDTSQEECMCFEVEFSLAAIDLEMELWSFLYQVDSRGEIEF